MKIACLGWGSLIWRPDNLLIRREWFSDGPFLQIEFARQSKDGRLTLVITEEAKPVRALWALMATDDLSIAKNSLLIREGIPKAKINTLIGSVIGTEETTDNIKLTIQKWANNLKLDAVIWTNLSSKFNDTDGRVPTMDEAVTYLHNANINTRTTAEEYIRKTPKQIDTDYRRRFEAEFGWTYIE
jgi:hypothetical protein